MCLIFWIAIRHEMSFDFYSLSKIKQDSKLKNAFKLPFIHDLTLLLGGHFFPLQDALWRFHSPINIGIRSYTVLICVKSQAHGQIIVNNLKIVYTF